MLAVSSRLASDSQRNAVPDSRVCSHPAPTTLLAWTRVSLAQSGAHSSKLELSGVFIKESFAVVSL